MYAEKSQNAPQRGKGFVLPAAILADLDQQSAAGGKTKTAARILERAPSKQGTRSGRSGTVAQNNGAEMKKMRSETSGMAVSVANATVQIELIDGPKASQYLTLLLENQRPLRESRVLTWATEMENNNWRLSSDAILIVKGRLANGQHRLHAVALCNRPCWFLVLRTDDEEIYKVLDSGINRTIGDALHGAGMEMGRLMAAVGMMAVRYDRQAITAQGYARERMSKITRTDIIDYVEEHKTALEKEIREVVALQAQRRILAVSLGASLLHLANRSSKGDAWAFIRGVYLGGTADAAFDVRERLIRNNSSKMKMRREYIFALLIKAYRSYVNGTRPGVLRIVEGEEFPKFEVNK